MQRDTLLTNARAMVLEMIELKVGYVPEGVRKVA